MVNCYIYAHYGFGLGHLQRSKLIALALKKIGYDVTLFSSGTKLPKEFIPKELKFIQLESEEPTLIYAQNAPSNKNITKEEMINKRIKKVINTFKKRAPEIFISEFFPFSPFRLEKTLSPILEYISKNYPECLVISSLRDIPLTRLEKKKIDTSKIKRYLDEYYDLILVHSKKELSSFAEKRKLGNFKTKVPILFTGYVSSESTKTKEKKYRIVISSGGGRDGNEMTLKSLKAVELLSKKGYIIRTLASTGPLGNIKTIKSRKNVKIVRFIPDLSRYIKKADLSINMAGYNTITEIFHSGIPAIIFPRKGSYEQNERARIIANYRKNLNLVYQQDLSVEELANKILKGLKQKKYPPLKVVGAKNTAKIINQVYLKKKQ